MPSPNYAELYIDLLKSVLCASLYDESAWKLVEGPMKDEIAAGRLPTKIISTLKHAFLRYLRAKNLAMVRTIRFDADNRASGFDWPLFGYTMTGRKRLDALQACIE
jgi:hypothetical protein